RVDYQGRAAGRHPDYRVAQLKDFLYLRMSLEDPKISLAHRLDGKHGYLVGELFVDPDAADFQAVSPGDLTEGRLGKAGLVPQVVGIDRQFDAQFSRLNLVLFPFLQRSAGLLVDPHLLAGLLIALAIALLCPDSARAEGMCTELLLFTL